MVICILQGGIVMTEQNEVQGVKYEGVLSKGFGLILQLITRDKSLSVEAKAIYAYLAAFAGNDQRAFPSVRLMCSELNISENRYLKHRKQLLDKGYIQIKRKRLENGFSKNIYILKQDIPVSIENVGIGNVGIQNVCVGNEGTNKNSSNKNNINKQQNKNLQVLYQFFDEHIGNRNFTTDQELLKLLEAYKDPLLIVEALKIAAKNGKTLFPYAKGVLRKMTDEKNKSVSLEDRVKSKPTTFGGHQLPF